MLSKEENIQYWATRALERQGLERTSNDIPLRELEVNIISKLLRKHSRPESVIIDLGCGDGQVENMAIIDTKSFGKWYGIDPTKELIELTTSRSKVDYLVGDSNILSQLEQPDILFTIRALINVADLDETYRNIAAVCKPTTELFFCEATVQGLERINSARAFFNLPLITPPVFNKYIDEEKISDHFDIIEVHHFASAYYFGSRIVNVLANDGPIDYYSWINQFFKQLPSFGDWGVHRLIHCRAKA